MRLITWNIQYGKGCDGIVDLARIAATAKALGDADVYCFQEISCCFPKLDGGTDQSAAIAALFPNHRAIYRPAVEIIGPAGEIRSFGNLTLSRLPVLQIANHLLPLPGAGRDRGMRRQALEVTIAAPFGPMRIVNTHLEFFSALQRAAQVARLLDLQQEASTSPKQPARDAADAFAGVAAASSLLCGDFNFDVSDPQHAMIHGATRPGSNYRDAWTIAHPGVPHLATCGIYDRELWATPDCRDFIFVSEDIAPRVASLIVDGATDASDHQPLLIELKD